jgi:hypothetical protein
VEELGTSSTATAALIGVAFLTLLVHLTAFAGDRSQADVRAITRDAPESWVLPDETTFDSAAKPAAGDSVHTLLLDRQVRVDARGYDLYFHWAAMLSTPSAVAEDSQVSIVLDPSYQKLTLHFLQIIRDGKVLEQRDTARVTVLPNETEIDFQIYNGGTTVNLLMSDVRVGDIVEYAYTVRSENLLFAGHYAARFETRWSEPVDRQRLRLVFPAGRPLRYEGRRESTAPEVRVNDGWREITWSWRNVEALRGEPNVPDWYDFWPSIEVSDMPTWGAVALWASDLYKPLFQAGPRTREIAAGIRKQSPTVDARVLAALRFVQDEIRYASILIGPGSHRPSMPDQVIERRFGDCKDKSLLLTMLLRELGIEASPALVHTRRGAALAERLPTPYAFDHVIVRVSLEDSRTYWLDPTLSYQRGTLANLIEPDYQQALLIGAGTTNLTTMPRPLPGQDRMDTQVRFDLRGGLDAPATMTTMTLYRGQLADIRRARHAQETASDREANGAAYFANFYPGIEAIGPPTTRDDPEANEFLVEGKYRLPRPSTTSADAARVFQVYADALDGFTKVPGLQSRTSPLSHPFPAWIRQRIQVLLPDDWSVPQDVIRIENSAFQYRSEVAYRDKVIELSYDFKSLADHVPPAQVRQYASDMERLSNDVAFRIWKNSDKGPAGSSILSAGIAVVPALALLLTLGLAAFVSVRYVYRWDAPARDGGLDNSAPRGLGGWLLLPGLSAISTPFIVAFIVWEAGTLLLDLTAWNGIPTIVAPEYRAAAQSLLLAIGCLGVALLAYSITSLMLFFNRRTSAPWHWIAVTVLTSAYVLGLVIALTVMGLDTTSPGESIGPDLARQIIFTTIWSTYMVTSERVRATFTTLFAGAALPAAAPATG